MREHNSKIAAAAELYLQRKAVERSVREAALETVRMIAAGCSDPVQRAQAVLDLEDRSDQARPSPRFGAHSGRGKSRAAGADIRE